MCVPIVNYMCIVINQVFVIRNRNAYPVLQRLAPKPGLALQRVTNLSNSKTKPPTDHDVD